MEGDALKKVQAGDALEIPARFYNAAIDVIRAHKGSAFDTGGVPLEAQKTVLCYAEDAVTHPFALVELPNRASYLNYANRNEWTPHCCTPTVPWCSTPGVAQEACPAGALVPVVMWGLTALEVPKARYPRRAFGTEPGTGWPIPLANYGVEGPIRNMGYILGAHTVEGVACFRYLVFVNGDRGTNPTTIYQHDGMMHVLAVGDGYTVGYDDGIVTITKV